MPTASQAVTPSQLFRRLSTILATDLSDGADLLEITYILVLRNLLKNFKRCGSKAYAFLRIVVPYIVLVSGVYGATLDLNAPSTALKAVISRITAPLTARIVVSANSPAKRVDCLAWNLTEFLCSWLGLGWCSIKPKQRVEEVLSAASIRREQVIEIATMRHSRFAHTSHAAIGSMLRLGTVYGRPLSRSDGIEDRLLGRIEDKTVNNSRHIDISQVCIKPNIVPLIVTRQAAWHMMLWCGVGDVHQLIIAIA